MRTLNDGDVLELFRKSGALLAGHFRLSSGLHSDRYLEKFRLVEDPAALEPLCAEMAERWSSARIDLVLGPTTAGIILAYCVARNLGVGARYAEPASGGRELRRGQVMPAGSRVLVVDDILTTGLSVRECLQIVQANGARAVGVGVLADRSGGQASFGVPLRALLTLDVPAYEPEVCPQCASGEPLTQRGSRAIV